MHLIAVFDAGEACGGPGRERAGRRAGKKKGEGESAPPAAPTRSSLSPLSPPAKPRQGGEFGRGSALQYGEADISGKDFHGQDLRRSNFTSADCRNADFRDAKLQGAFFMKAVAFRTNFEGADLSDVLMGERRGRWGMGLRISGGG